jgi:prepilin-type N-terminal cleavage/methylation domain-containing protein
MKNKLTNRFNARFKGFTLIEVSIVLLIVGLLLMGGINLMSSSGDIARYKQVQTDMIDIKESLVSYYSVNHFLPCPDTDGDGIENPPAHTGTCTSSRGFLPHVTLGVGGNGDVWGERIKYLVTGDSTNFFTTAATACNYLRPAAATASTIRIQDLNTAAINYIGDYAAFALLSTAKNGTQTNLGMAGAFSADGGCLTRSALEQENCNADSVLRFGVNMSDGTNITFDDLVIWVGDMQLISELRKAGVCNISSNTPPISPVSRTTTDFTANAGQAFAGSYGSTSNANTSGAADKVTIGGSLNSAINLQDGNNTLSISGSTAATITAGSGDDVVRVLGDLQSPANLGAGNDYLEVWGNTTSAGTIDMGTGNDSVRIEASVNGTVALGSGSNSIYVGGSIGANITATGGTAIVYYDHATMSTAEKSRVSTLSPVMCRANTSSPWGICA